MAGMGDFALGAAPVAGGAALAALVGTVKGPDFRALIKSDIELHDSLPEDSVEIRAELKRTIDARLYELIATIDANRELRMAAGSHKGNWRDIVMFVCALLFTTVWWYVPHGRTNWLPTFVILVILCVVVGWSATQVIVRAVKKAFTRS